MSEAFKLAPHEWALLRGLLDEALALPAPRRAAWLAELEETRAQGLKPRLQALLANAGNDDDPATAARLLQTLPKVETGQFAPLPGSTTEKPGDAIGPYRLIRELGSGGMGSVWLAERTDMLQGRQVALKLPHGAWKRAGLAERLAREREILATLEHPHIARLYDAGLAADGQPWLALEYAQGERIDVHCRTKELPVPARLRLFLQVAQAVAHAHAQLVVHRDLKPANILVTDAGEVKLLDFGIAKLVQEGVVEETELTRDAGRVLTPEYASPEQILGKPIGTASDVYSLGVVLFELLADGRPYRLQGAQRSSRAALEEAIVAADVPRPSTVARLAWRKALRGDLDTIVLKALKREPAERYATVAALADDVQRHLEQRAVLAQPDSAWYRAGKFIRRNRLAVAAGSAIGVALVMGTGVATWQAREARAQSGRADEARRLVESIFVDADPIREAGRPLTAVELLRQAKARVTGLEAIDPQVRMGLLNTVAASMLNLHDVEGAGSVLRDAAATARELPPADGEVLRMRRLSAHFESASGRNDQARRILAEMLPLIEARPERYGDELFAALQSIAQIENEGARYREAQAAAGRLIETLERLDRRRSPFMVSALSQLANANDYLRRSDEAHEAARRAHDLARDLYPGTESHPLVNSTRMFYAKTLADRDDVDAALDLMRQAQRTAAAMFGENSLVAGRYSGIMTSFLGTAGYSREALAASKHAMQVLGPTFQKDGMPYAALLDQVSVAALANFDGAAALEAATRSREIIVARAGADHESAFVMQVARARAVILLGQPAQAAAWLEEMLDQYQKRGASGISTPAYFLGQARRLMGQPADALPMLDKALQAVRPGPRAKRLSSRVLVEIGLCHLALGQPDKAGAALTEALATQQTKFRVATPDRAAAQLGLARVALAQQRPIDALPLAEQAERFWNELAPQSRWAGEAAYWQGRVLAALGREADARSAMARAATILADSPLAIDRPLREQARKLAGASTTARP